MEQRQRKQTDTTAIMLYTHLKKKQDMRDQKTKAQKKKQKKL